MQGLFAACIALVIVVAFLLRPLPQQCERREGFAKSKTAAKEKQADYAARDLLRQLQDALQPLHPKVSTLIFRESTSSHTDDKTFVYLCLRDPKTGQFYKWNDLIYVALHECAHAISKGYDPTHSTQEFQSNFLHLLRAAEKAGIYTPNDAFVEEYCSMRTLPTDGSLYLR